MSNLTPAQQVAESVKDVQTYDPGLGSYGFKDLGAVVKFSEVMAKAGEMLPDHLRNKPALCMAITMRATHWGFDPFALAMETYQAKQGGPIGYQAKVFTAALRHAGVVLKYRYEGDIKMLDQPAKSSKGNQVAARTATGTRKCIAWAIVDGEKLEAETLTLDEITIKNSPLWHNDPDSQLAYAAGRTWARRYRSDVIMGAYSADEVQEMTPMRDVTPEKTAFQQKVEGARKAAEPEPEQEDAVPEAETVDAPHWTEAVDTAGAFPGDDEFTEGVKAHQAGMKREMCPHEEEIEKAISWLGGWDEAAKADQ